MKDRTKQQNIKNPNQRQNVTPHPSGNKEGERRGTQEETQKEGENVVVFFLVVIVECRPSRPSNTDAERRAFFWPRFPQGFLQRGAQNVQGSGRQASRAFSAPFSAHVLRFTSPQLPTHNSKPQKKKKKRSPFMIRVKCFGRITSPGPGRWCPS